MRMSSLMILLTAALVLSSPMDATIASDPAPAKKRASLLLVRGAGGDVIDIHGSPVRDNGHIGPFVAGLWNERRLAVVQKILERIRARC